MAGGAAGFRALLLFAGLALLAPPALARGEAPPERAAAEISATELPAEARQTIALVRNGGPFPYPRDGIEFRNFGNRLPVMPRGYSRQYTVRSPDAKDRGARPLVAGRAG